MSALQSAIARLKASGILPEQRYRALPTDEQRDCIGLGTPLCGQEHKPCGEKLRSCDTYGQCTTVVKQPNVACCDGGRCNGYDDGSVP